LIGITMGCPVGIGPEITLKFLRTRQVEDHFQPIVIGDFGVFSNCARTLGLEVDIIPWQPGDLCKPGAIMIHQPPYAEEVCLTPGDLIWGRPCRPTGLAMAAAIEATVRLVRSGVFAAMVTCPITKSALQGAGYNFPGHTEMLAALCQTSEYAMMMAGRSLKVTLVTIHQGLATVASALSQDGILRLIELTGRSLTMDFGLPDPRMAVAGLNPHAGEGGLFGDEEGRVIAPAVALARSRGWQVDGPFPPDTVFHKVVSGHYDAVICMYHDQGLIPFKLLHFADGVNVTIGLPIVRTSVDHGTAYDIAGQGKADPASLREAFRMAGEIVRNRQRAQGDCRSRGPAVAPRKVIESKGRDPLLVNSIIKG
jgi:4-hydroxythreonine-4-phosphate dehydrogenase